MCISNKIGPPVEGDDFFGREKEIKKSNRLLDSNHSLLLSAPRRIGKSSFAKRLIEEKKNQRWKCVYIDYTLSKVLVMLENDGYIIKKDALRMFRSPLLRDYWLAKFVL